MNIQFSSQLLNDAIEAFSQLPGVGKKTALRLVLFLLKQDSHKVEQFAHAITRLRNEVHYCSICHNISDEDKCTICSNQKRKQNSICVVENIRDVIAIENTQQYFGLYHVLGGIISPLDGIGPADLNIGSLVTRCENSEITEILMALPTTMEGDTTNFYLYKKLNRNGLNITTLSRGVSIGDDLEYTDEITLGRSIVTRRPFIETLKQ